jgi:hypothetical protein
MVLPECLGCVLSGEALEDLGTTGVLLEEIYEKKKKKKKKKR